MKALQKGMCVVGASAIAFTISMASAPAAQAYPMYECRYPLVCVYRTPAPDANYLYYQFNSKPGWQKLPTSVSNYSIVNTRNNDVAYYYGTVSAYDKQAYSRCVSPNTWVSGGSGTVTHIYISESPNC